MNVSAVCTALVPIFFVLLLGYLAGKAHSFDSDQAAGLGKLALGFALPAALFAGMSALPQGLLATQLKLVLCLIAVHVGLFLLAHLILHTVFHVDTARSIIFSLILVATAAPIFGGAVLAPLLGNTTMAAVGLVALAFNLVVPLAITLFEIDAASKPLDQENPQASQTPKRSPVIVGLIVGLKSPLLWAPILGGALALSGVHLPKFVSGSFTLIGSATGGVAIFSVGIMLSVNPLVLSRSILLGTLGRISLQALCLFGLAKLLHIEGPIYRDAFVCCTFPVAAIVNLLAAKYKTAEAEAASILLLSTIMMAVTVPLVLYISR